jgi:hypothetical protein
MARKRAPAECAYCGEVRPWTEDHVPAKSIYLSPVPNARPWVKSCFKCNNGASDDDEYFLHKVLQYHRVGEQDRVQPLVAAMVRAVGKPQKRAYGERTLKSLRLVDVQTPGGLFLGKEIGVAVDAARIERAASRYLRGLHLLETGTRVRADQVVVVNADPERNNLESDTIMGAVKRGTLRPIQDGVFHYAFRRQGRDASLWVLIFYDVFPVVGLIARRDQLPAG